jgi:hypothetical protein
MKTADYAESLAREATTGTSGSSSCPESLLETIRQLRSQVGDGLDDDEFTFFLQKQKLPAEAGFGFLCFHDGCVTLSVPAQDDPSWHPANGWIPPAKEQVGLRLARKLGLSLSEPPDAPRVAAFPGAGGPHHHLRLATRKENLVIAHPEYLKVRLYASDTKLPLRLEPGLLEELSELYR